MEIAEPVLGSFKAHNQHMHIGPGAHILHFPVAAHTFLNIVAFVDEPNDWPLGDPNSVGNMVAPAVQEDVQAAFEGWGPTVCSLVKLLPEKFDKWAIFDSYDYPAPTFINGRVCLAGDAAHASSPHHGAGAGIGVEDALALCTLLEKGLEKLSNRGRGEGVGNGFHAENEAREKSAIIEAAWSVYNKVRPPRSQWLVKSSREACDIYEWKYPETKTDWNKCLAEITARSHKLWYFDFKGMLDELQL
jgi:salicylate hydroxylase